MSQNDLMDKIVSLCKRRGFVFQSSEIYGGLANAWDYGPLGVELKNNVKQAWWKANIHHRDDMAGLDASILMSARVWEASGHAGSFSDPFVQCPSCKKYIRLDKAWDEVWQSEWCNSLLQHMEGNQDTLHLKKWAEKKGKKLAPNLSFVKDPNIVISFLVDTVENWGPTANEFKQFISRMACNSAGVPKVPCSHCGETLPDEGKAANLMLTTSLGPVEETAEKVYLRPETAQGIFVNFQNVVQATNRKLPFGIGQIGKSFRNEMGAGNFTFRLREFEQMEIEYFTDPEKSDEYYQSWIENRFQWYKDLGINPDNLRLRPHDGDELAHYAKGCTDVEYQFPFGWSELEGIAHRGDFDLKQHAEFSGKDLQYNDQVNNKKFFPHVIEPSGGCDRATLAFLVDAFREEDLGEGKSRTVLKFHPDLAPIKVAVLPLLKKKPEIVAMCQEIKQDLQKDYTTMYNDTAAIGKLYRRQDEVGTPFCVTVDVDSLEDKCVTVRDRDTMQQERVSTDKLKQYLKEKLG